MMHECRRKPIAIRHLSDSGDLKRPVMTDKYSNTLLLFCAQNEVLHPHHPPSRRWIQSHECK